eukprot:877139-Lingulodinium_polyedra.AAC.1
MKPASDKLAPQRPAVALTSTETSADPTDGKTRTQRPVVGNTTPVFVVSGGLALQEARRTIPHWE